MLPDADEQDGYVCRVDQTDQSANHVADGVALRNDETVKRPN